MGRLPRSNSPGSWHHVVNRGAARQDIFFDVRDRAEFEELLALAHERFGVRVHVYCLMTNHYHLLLECPDGGLSEAMHLIGSVYVRRFNKRQGRDGPLFRDRFYAKPVTSDAYLMRLVRYIHRNPLAFSSIDQLRSYRWSSFRAYLGHRRVPPWMSVDHVLGMFDGPRALDRYVTMSEAPGGPPVPRDDWLSAVDLMVDEHLDDRVRNHASTAVSLLLLDQLDGERQAALTAALGFPSPAAERVARSRARRRAEVNPELRHVVDRVFDLAA